MRINNNLHPEELEIEGYEMANSYVDYEAMKVMFLVIMIGVIKQKNIQLISHLWLTLLQVLTLSGKNVNTARPKAIVNVARLKVVLNVVKGNQVNAVKASACWVWKPKTKVINHVSKYNSASTILKKLIDIDAQGRIQAMDGLKASDMEHVPILLTFKKLMEDMMPLEVELQISPPLKLYERPFGCPVTISYHRSLSQVDDKVPDEGFFVGYSINSKAFRVFNSRTRIVEENLHVQFSENTHNIERSIKACDDADAGFKPSGDNEKRVTEEPRKEGGDPINVVSSNTRIELLNDPNMPKLEDIVYSDDYEDVGAEADMNKLHTFYACHPIPTTRIHKDHPVEQIIGDLNSAPQTRIMTKNLEEHGLFNTVQQRTNHKDFQNCLFACLLLQEEPKKVIHTLKDPSWIEAMQDELLQFKL
ncbi:hypothetical protein Tco_0704960 [Tanacetum coccineum]|uniref:Retroviral polymerase SH3-like domain-containing protein n=1 Tax=Tanacetum coccineum TaxID=301880 RepID=A0ABQ4Y3A9_9ASTR